MRMNYMYVLKLSNGQIYIGFTGDLKKRIGEHGAGKVFTTKKYLPVSLIYYESYLAKSDAKHREFTLKTHGGGYRHLKERIKNSINAAPN